MQLDTVSVAGARSHAIVLHSRIPRFPAARGEELLRPGSPFFEYWGHEVCWLPLELYPYFEFRRKEFRKRPWWKDAMSGNKALAREVLRRVEDSGPTKSADWEGPGSRGWWDHKPAKRVLEALFCSGDLAVRERKNFIRAFDLPDRVHPEWHDRTRAASPTLQESLRRLLLVAVAGHGWATTGTLAQTWRLRNRRREILDALETLVEEGSLMRCRLAEGPGTKTEGWIRPQDRDLADRLRRKRFRPDRGVLLSPFDPVLWDRARVRQLFGFDQVLEIFKPAAQRVYGYYCLPVLAGEHLVARLDLKADRGEKTLEARAIHFEDSRNSERKSKSASGVDSRTRSTRRNLAAQAAVESALRRYSASVGLSFRDGIRRPARKRTSSPG